MVSGFCTNLTSFSFSGTPEPMSKGSVSEASLLSPPPEFGKQTPTQMSEASTTATAKKPAQVLKKEYDSEPCVLDAVAKHQQAHAGRYRSVDLSMKGLDKCCRLRARSFGHGSKSWPHTAYPMLVKKSPGARKSPPIKLTIVRPSKCNLLHLDPGGRRVKGQIGRD